MMPSQKGRVVTWGDKISATMKGRKLPLEHRQKLSIANMGYVAEPLERLSTTGLVELDDQETKLDIHNKVLISLPD